MFDRIYDEMAGKIIDKMTLEEKVYALTPKDNQYCPIPSQDFFGPTPQDVPAGGADNWPTGKAVYGEDGLPNDGKYHPVAFPSNSSVAMSWDKKFVYQVGQLFAKEAKANPDKVHLLNRPGMNLKRSPLCGRNYDYLSEDPVLTGILGTEYVKGIQSENIGACPKHFIANNQEFDRMNTNACMNERVFEEIYLRPWKMVLQNAKPWMIMSSYNKVNGEWVNSSKQCMNALRNEIGYDGVVVSDFLAIHHNKIEAHNHSMDIELADSAIHMQEVLDALKSGEIREETIDGILRRQLRMALHAADLENHEEIDMDEYHQEARRIAKQCITLLKNDGILPLDSMKRGKILVAGQLAAEPNVEGSGSGYMNGYKVDVPLEEIENLAKKQGIEIIYSQGYQMITACPPVDADPDQSMLNALENNIKKSDLVIAFVGAPYGYESESYDRPHIRLQKNQQAMLDALTAQTSNVIIVLTGGSVYDLSPWNDKVKGVVFAGFAGEGYGNAIAEILFGKGEPGGRLAETFPLREEHGPAYFDFTPAYKEMPHVNYSEGLLTGYRWYDTRKLPVLYPFGHGLSYTTFSYSVPKADRIRMTPDDEMRIWMEVTNTGNRAGSQVIQLYVHERAGLFKRPEKELRDFVKVFLKPKETKKIEFCLSRKDFEVFSDALHKWGVQSDTYDILLNVSANETVGRLSVEIENGDQMFFFTEMSPLAWFLNCPAFYEYLKENEPEWKQEFFSPDKTAFVVLMLPLPFYRLSEPLRGDAFFSMEQIREIVACCNQYMKINGKGINHNRTTG